MAVETERPTTGRAEPAAAPRGSLDPYALRADFPILQTSVHGHRWSTSTPPRRARSRRSSSTRSTRFYREYNANVHRGIYEIGERATAAYERPGRRSRGSSTRPTATRSSSPGTRPRRSTWSPTRWGRRNIGRGDAIVLTEMEHHANLVPWQLLVQEKDADLEFIPITDDGVLRLDVLDVLAAPQAEARRLDPRSNTLGTINPVREIVARAHAAGALVLRRWRPGRPAPARRRPGASAPTSTPSAATRCSARPARACCGRGASCSRRCRRSSAAAR